ncbi:MAG: hypothetical protein TREMPRED_003056 [Tremellales sp. Tagirdzhanova-0007]|nr:MAG: hypothetical protein TREMPRED_003056 [Tremellales sp. Tagirdzhanova-0007]
MASSMVPQEELPVLEAFIYIRIRLTALKKDTTNFIRAQDVMPIYNSVVKQVTRLNAIRDEQTEQQSTLSSNAPSSSTASNGAGPAPPEPNRVDTIIADVFGLLSLFFLTVGKSRETPATYCQIVAMRQLLLHMNESGGYTETMLQPLRQRLDALKTIMKQDSAEGKHPDPIVRLMMKKLEGVERLLNELTSALGFISVELVPIHQRLVELRRQLAFMTADAKPNKVVHKAILEELRKIDLKRVDGKFLGPGGSSVPEGQALLSGILDSCFEVAQELKAREAEEEVGPMLKPIHERLSEMKEQLDRLHGQYVRISGAPVSFVRLIANPQALLFLLRRCYGLMYRLMSESEPISEELMPVANKLSTIKKCLTEVLKYGGPYAPRDLYPYHLALHQIDSLRKDGKFYADDGSIPEGQAILVAQLSEAHELLEMLKESMSEGESDSE